MARDLCALNGKNGLHFWIDMGYGEMQSSLMAKNFHSAIFDDHDDDAGTYTVMMPLPSCRQSTYGKMPTLKYSN